MDVEQNCNNEYTASGFRKSIDDESEDQESDDDFDD